MSQAGDDDPGGTTPVMVGQTAYDERLRQAGDDSGPSPRRTRPGAVRRHPAAGNAQTICEAHGLEWEAADLQTGPGVTIKLDILDDDAVGGVGRRWPSVLVFNLLEHVYDPTKALRNAVRLLEPGGTCAIAGPAVWRLHDFPADYWRPMPDFFIEFARREGLSLIDDQLKWLLLGRTLAVSSTTANNGQKSLPASDPEVAKLIWGTPKATFSRAIHKIFRTYGRENAFPLSGLGVVLRKGDVPSG